MSASCGSSIRRRAVSSGSTRPAPDCATASRPPRPTSARAWRRRLSPRACATPCSRPRATGCAGSPALFAGTEGAGEFRVAPRADVVAPATRSHAIVEAAIAGLTPGEGTAIGDAIARSIQVAQQAPAGASGGSAADEHAPAAILLLSDGAQTQGGLTPAAAARRAQAQKIPVYTVALGTPDGVVERTLPGGLHERIRVPPDPQTLRQVATATGGEFYAAPDQARLRRVYEQLGSRLGSERDQREITFAFAAAGGVLTFLAGLVSELWFRRMPSL